MPPRRGARGCPRNRDAVSPVLANTSPAINTACSGLTTGTALQLKQIARIIEARATFGAKRQFFFASLGGFATHDDELNVQGGRSHNSRRRSRPSMTRRSPSASLIRSRRSRTPTSHAPSCELHARLRSCSGRASLRPRWRGSRRRFLRPVSHISPCAGPTTRERTAPGSRPSPRIRSGRL